jgi:hypothetical protein
LAARCITNRRERPPRYSQFMRVGAVMVAVLVLASVAAGLGESASVSGLRGVVMRGPTKPVCFEGEPCEAPAAGLTLRFGRAGAVIAQVKTGPAGGYSVRLRAGVYTVTTPNGRPLTQLTPRRVLVPLGRMARVNFHLDTGIQ